MDLVLYDYTSRKLVIMAMSPSQLSKTLPEQAAAIGHVHVLQDVLATVRFSNP